MRVWVTKKTFETWATFKLSTWNQLSNSFRWHAASYRMILLNHSVQLCEFEQLASLQLLQLAEKKS